jgi:hypothetical protein
MAHETPGGELKWRVIWKRNGQYDEMLVQHLNINGLSFSLEDEMPVVRRKDRIACYGTFGLQDGQGIGDP